MIIKEAEDVSQLRGAAKPTCEKNSPETALLLAIARVELRPADREVLNEVLTGVLDWGHLLALAARHGLEPLLFHHLYAVSGGAVPESVLYALREECRVIAGRNMILASKLKGISAHLSARGVRHLAYKGPVLAEVYYGNCALRVFRDLDILVPAAELEAARRALEELGFRDKTGMSAAQLAASFRYGFEHSFTADGGLDLDLHWRVVQRFKAPAIAMDGIWKRAEMVNFLSGEVPTFMTEDLFVALCLHAGHHGWTQISHICDLHQILQFHPDFDWEIVLSHFGDSNTRRLVYACLYLLHECWGADLPEYLLSRIHSDPHIAKLARRVRTEIWTELSPRLTVSSLRWMLERSAGEQVGDRARLLAGNFFCPSAEDLETFRLPRVLASLYPGLRVLRLAYRYAFSRNAQGADAAAD